MRVRCLHGLPPHEKALLVIGRLFVEEREGWHARLLLLLLSAGTGPELGLGLYAIPDHGQDMPSNI